MTAGSKRRCCHVGCDADAVYEIWAGGPSVDPCDFINACPKHVGLLLGRLDGTGPATHWVVWEIAKVSQNHLVKRRLPVCPDCGAEMQRALFEDEEGAWSVKWLCDCVAEVPDPI